ncbi:MAG: hypothetical protein QXM22_06520 [Candidatus Bathyarchaeia archaeon]
MAKTKTEKKFAALLLEALDEAFLALGQTTRFSIYFSLETKFSLPKQDIPDRIEDFANALRKIFGNAAAPLEILIMKSLNEKIKCNCKWVGPKWLVPDLTLEKYLKLAQLSLENSGRKNEVTDFEVMLNEGETPEQET